MTGSATVVDDVGPIASILALLRFRCDNCKYKAAKNGKARESESDAIVYTYFIKATPRLLHYTTLVSEADVHRHFCDLRVKGEWFKITDKLLAYIEDLIGRDKTHDQQNT